MSPDRSIGESEWTFESIIRSVPGINVSRYLALAVQLLGFEAAVVLLAIWYDLPNAAVIGTVAVVVSFVGSVFMLGLSAAIRRANGPTPYRHLLFGSRMDILLGLIAFFLLLVYVFIYDPRTGGETLLNAVLGEQPPLVFAFVFLVIGWDVTYRIGVGWWASVVGFWRTYRFGMELSLESRARYRQIDAATTVFAASQLLFVPFLSGHPLLQIALVGHAVAVLLVSGASIILLR